MTCAPASTSPIVTARLGVKPVRRILGQIAVERGRSSEQRLLEACQLDKRPTWMLSARAGTRDEDARGIDVVLDTDVGKLYVQVKSSKTGGRHFKERKRSARIAVVVVRVDDTPDTLLQKVLSAVSPIRKEYLSQRKVVV